jgi:two-component system OmpR family response regulator
MRLLIVEDDAPLASGLSRILEAEGHAVDVTERGEDAVAAASQEHFDLVILDIGLPRMDGFEVLRRLRAAEKPIPVLVLTARDAVDDRVRGLDLGADDYLAKPFDFGELLARLRALVRRVPEPRPARLEVGDLVVDPSTHAVARAGVAVALTAREFAVLEYLARHAGEAITRATLLDHVWDENFDGSTNVVDVYVGYLRKKLEQPFGRPLIRTIRGVGYALEAER